MSSMPLVLVWMSTLAGRFTVTTVAHFFGTRPVIETVDSSSPIRMSFIVASCMVHPAAWSKCLESPFYPDKNKKVWSRRCERSSGSAYLRVCTIAPTRHKTPRCHRQENSPTLSDEEASLHRVEVHWRDRWARYPSHRQF